MSPLVLVVDPEQDNRELLAEVLAGWGLWPRVAGGAREALRLALEQPPDLLISELVLGDLGAEHLLDALHLVGGGGGPKSIALTSRCRAEDRRWARRIGFDHFLAKPADPAALYEIVVGRAARPGPAVLATFATLDDTASFRLARA